MALLSFGGFQLDDDARRIYSTDGELAAEPKVIEVLCYLIQHRDRLVPLTELHAEVWAGRVVTDTAVRRTISKLRALLGDTDPDAPLYIKSQMKRGYQFIGQPLPVQTFEASSISPIVAVDSVDLPTREKSSAARIKPAQFFYGFLSVALLALVFWSSYFTQETHQKTMMTTEPLVSIAGEKYFLSVSDNGRYQAFTGRLSKTEGWQPYLYDRQLGHLQKINQPLNAPFVFVSVLNNDTVIVSAIEDDKWKLYLYSIANLHRAIKTIDLKDFTVIGQVVPYQNNIVLINGQKIGDKNTVYYLLNLDDQSVKQFTFSSLQSSIDGMAALSPDKKYFAFIRRGTDFHVQVLGVDDKTLLAEQRFDTRRVPGDEVNLVWVNNQQLLINGGSEFKLLDIAKGTEMDLPVTERFSSLGRDQAGQLFGLLKQPQKRSFYQVQLSDLNSIQRYFSFDGQAVSLKYSQTPHKLWLVEKDQTSYQLYLYHPETGDKKLYFKSNELFAVVADSPNAADLILMFNDKQLKMLDLEHGQLTNISDINQSVELPTLTSDNKVVFFTEKIGDEWQVIAFDKSASSQRRILQGYRLFLPWKNQFIAVDAKGQFFLLDQQYQVLKLLPLNIDFNLLYQVSLHGNKLITANIGVDSHWKLATLDLVSEQIQHQVITTLPIKTKFSFNHEGSAAIVSVENDHENQLVKLGYNFGYN